MSKEVWNLAKDLCRCCHSEGSYKSLYTPYLGLEDEEVYSNMLRECLDIELVVAEPSQVCAICDACIEKLHDAAKFKRQVYDCEIRFRNVYRNEKNIVPVTKRLDHKSKGVSKIKVKKKVNRPRKHTVFLKSSVRIGYNNKDIDEIGYSNESMKEVGYNKSLEDIVYNNKSVEDIVYNNKSVEDIVYNNKSVEDIVYNNKGMEDIVYKTRRKIGSSNNSMGEFGLINNNIKENDDKNNSMEDMGYKNKKIEEIGYNDNYIKNNYNFTNGNDDSNLEYDSDTPISRLSKEYKDIFVTEKDKSDLEVLNESIKEVCKAPQYSVYGESKPVSERKRIRLTCETVLRDTTACPFRHHRSWFRCFYCTQDFMDIDKLRQHTLTSHTAEDIANIKRYPRSLQIDISDLACKLCRENLTDVQEMVEHFMKVHDKVVYKECIADYKVNTSPYTCHICRKQYHVFRTLTTHLNEHYANYICDVCGKPFLNTKRLKVHKRTHESGNFPCGECGKILKTQTSKANHMETHSKRILKCQLCAKPMKHYNDRIKHMSEEHNITHKFKCLICGREYNIKHYLATHMRQTHGHKNKKCGVCGMAFITNHGLKKHMLKHSGEKGFSCTICSKAYARSYTLKEHMRGHEKIS